jgi:hypothetical protein
MITLPLWVAIVEFIWGILALFFIGLTLPTIIQAIKLKIFIYPNTAVQDNWIM